MIVGGFSYVGTLARPVAPSASSPPPAPATPDIVPEDDTDANPTYFRAISSISHGSLATAYQVIKAHETGGSGTATDGGKPHTPFDEPAILSGMGMPAALSAYGEVLEADEF